MKYALPNVKTFAINDVRVKLQTTGEGDFPVTLFSCDQSDGCAIFNVDFGSQTPPPDGYFLQLTCDGTFTPSNCSSNPSLVSLSNCDISNVSGSVYSINCCFTSESCDMSGFLYLASGDCSGNATARIVNSSGDPLSPIITNADCPGLESTES